MQFMIEIRMCLIQYSVVLEVVHRQLDEFLSLAVCLSEMTT